MVDLQPMKLVLLPRMVDLLPMKLIFLPPTVDLPPTKKVLLPRMIDLLYLRYQFCCSGWLTSYLINLSSCPGWLTSFLINWPCFNGRLTSYLINWFCCPWRLTLCPLMMWLSSWAGQPAGHRSCLSSELHHSSPPKKGKARKFQIYLNFCCCYLTINNYSRLSWKAYTPDKSISETKSSGIIFEKF